ncbi:hypothetical protein BUALT_Bualt08G0086600 [Buddleja alternifolia]|uniref:Uncharacterized protein n=1 Tax=Buddleja alternifolia TaxID=168488 RepID=A0AAV6X8R6_9LAMI|nr:hypothetical protein BUALT_Bualt08G0086600 [Buddleja alternifolia]
MEAISPYKSHQNYPTKIHHHHHPFISRTTSNNIFPPNNFHTVGGGCLIQPPPPFLSHHSYPPFSLHQPPLLPLPAAAPRLSAAANRKPHYSTNKPRKELEKSKSPKKNNSPKKTISVSSTTPLGPDPRNLPNEVAKVLPFISSSAVEDDMYSGSVVCSISPPPSSLPLPTFSLRPKVISCKAEAAAAGIDAGATDDLRRLLRLR